MSRSESDSEVSSSSSDNSDNERSTNRDLVIPSPVKLSDSEDDGVSPSQHKLAMMKQLAHKNVAPSSTSCSDEEEQLVVEEEKNSLLMLNPALLLNPNRPQQYFRRLPR